MSPRSVLASAPVEQVTFAFNDPSGGSWEEDDWGQDVWVPGGRGELVTQFAPFKRTQVEFQPGANPEAVEGRGELVEPLDFPASVRVDSVLQCTFNGGLWDARITNIIPNDLTSVAFGAYFEATLTPAAAPADPDPDPDPDPGDGDDEGGTGDGGYWGEDEYGQPIWIEGDPP